jgi:hypothetical protein
MSPGYPLNEESTAEYEGHPGKADICHPEAPTMSWNQVGARRLAMLHVQKNRDRQGGQKGRPKKNPAPSKAHCNRVIKHVAMPPLRRSSSLSAEIGAPTIEACRANMLSAQLQVTQRAQETSAPLATRLKCLVRMKEARRLVDENGRGIRALSCDRPISNLQFCTTENTDLRSVFRRRWRNRSLATRTADSPQN